MERSFPRSRGIWLFDWASETNWSSDKIKQRWIRQGGCLIESFFVWKLSYCRPRPRTERLGRIEVFKYIRWPRARWILFFIPTSFSSFTQSRSLTDSLSRTFFYSSSFAFTLLFIHLISEISISAMYTSITFLLAIAASVQAANNVPQKVTYTAAGASAVTGNGFGCAHSACPFPLPSFHHTKSNTLTTQSHPLDRVLSSAASSTFSQTASRLASPSESMHS